MDKTRLIANRLWSIFLPSIRAGNQMYFCFSRQLIRASLEDIFDGDAVEDFFDLASKFYLVRGTSCSLDETIFDTDQNGKSLVILLIAQQVLVVEDMVSEGGITEEAYFPRLRSRISTQLGSGSHIPISSAQFNKVWDTFKSEIIKSGAKESAVTFFKGLGSNVHRSFPMSQALLSSQDLISLFEKFPNDLNLQRTSDESLYNLIFKLRYSISSRARNVLRVNWLRQRLLNQIRNFSSVARTEIREIETRLKRLQEIEIRVYADDIFDDAFELRGVSPKGEYIEDLTTVHNAIQNRLDKAPCIFFGLTAERDYWTLLSSDRELNPGETLVILTSEKLESKAQSILKGYWSNFKDVIEPVKLSDGFISYLLKIPVSQQKSLTIQDGLLTSKAARGALVWQGGICVDQRSNRFLIGFPPDSLSSNGIIIKNEETLQVADRSTTVRKFLEEIKDLRQEHFFTVKVKGIESKIHFADYKSAYPIQFGHNFDGRIFSVVPEEVTQTDICLRGYVFNAANFNRKTIKRNDVFKILDTDRIEWVSLTFEEQQTLQNILLECDLPSPVKKIAIQIIKEKMACPLSLKADIFEAA